MTEDTENIPVKVKSKNEIEGVLLHADLLYHLLFNRAGVVVKHFMYPDLVAEVFPILSPLYNIQELNLDEVDPPEYLSYFLQCANEGNLGEMGQEKEKLPFLIFTNLRSEFLPYLMDKTRTGWLAVNCNPELDLSELSHGVIFDNKIQKIETNKPYSMDLVLNSAQQKAVMQWVQQKILIPLKQGQPDQMEDALLSLKTGVLRVVSALTDTSLNEIPAVLPDFSTTEQILIRSLVNKWLHLTVSDEVWADITKEQSPVQKTPKKKLKLKKIKKTPKQIVPDVEKEASIIEKVDKIEEIEEIEEIENIDGSTDEMERLEQEFLRITAVEYTRLYLGEVLIRVAIPSELQDQLTQPRQVYAYLRTHVWQDGIPLEICRDVLLLTCREKLKTMAVSASMLDTFIRDEHEALCTGWGKLCPMKFWKFEPDDFAYVLHDGKVTDNLSPEDPNALILPTDQSQGLSEIIPPFLKKDLPKSEISGNETEEVLDNSEIMDNVADSPTDFVTDYQTQLDALNTHLDASEDITVALQKLTLELKKYFLGE
jgi:hypothetical protein